jgi:uncharacterized membrane protein YgdD (TMEM256/DUF423 family)
MNSRLSLIIAATFGFFGVALGAFGAHAFKAILIENGRLETYELATRYVMYHALAMLFVGLADKNEQTPFLKYAAGCFTVGMLLFSGSLLLLSFTSSTAIAFVTPVGGFALIAGWLLTAIAIIRSK